MLLSAAALAFTATPAFAAVTPNPTLTGTTVSTIPAITLTSDLGAGTTIDWTITGPTPGNSQSAVPGSHPSRCRPRCPGTMASTRSAPPTSGGAQTAIATFTVDRTPPGPPGTPTITGTTNPTPLATPTFAWTQAEADGSYEWQVLSGATVVQTARRRRPRPRWPRLRPAPTPSKSGNATPSSTRGRSQPSPSQLTSPRPTGGSIAHVPVANQVAGFTRTGTASVNLTVASTDNLAGTITYALTTAATPAPAAAAFAAWSAARSVTVSTAQGCGPPPSSSGPVTPRERSRPRPLRARRSPSTPRLPTVLATSFPLPGVNLTTAFGTLANVQINFNEPVQNPVSLIRLCVNPCGLADPGVGDLQRGDRPIAILDPTADPRDRHDSTRSSSRRFATAPETLLTGPVASSPWTFSTSADGTPPGPVADLPAVAGVGQLGLTWSTPADPDLARITVLRGTAAPASAGDATAVRFSLPATRRASPTSDSCPA